MKLRSFFLILVVLFIVLVSASSKHVQQPRSAEYDFEIRNELKDGKLVHISCVWEPKRGEAFTDIILHGSCTKQKLEVFENQDAVYNCTWNVEDGDPSERTFSALRTNDVPGTAFQKGAVNNLIYTMKQGEEGGKIYLSRRFKFLAPETNVRSVEIEFEIHNKLEDEKAVDISCQWNKPMREEAHTKTINHGRRSLKQKLKVFEDQNVCYSCRWKVEDGVPQEGSFRALERKDIPEYIFDSGEECVVSFTIMQQSVGGKIEIEHYATWHDEFGL